MDYKKNNLRQEYLKQSVMTACNSELIVMLFDSCIKNLKLAEICYEERHDVADTNNHFMRAQKIIMELVNCLDTSIDLSFQLLRIYDYLLRTMREMNVKKDFTPLPGLVELLGSMRDTWEQAAKLRYVSSEVS